MHLIEYFLGVIAPNACIGCNREGDLLCAECCLLLPAIPARCYRCGQLAADSRTCLPCRRRSPLFSVQAVTPYDASAKDLLHKLKFERARAAAGPIAQCIAQQLHLPQGVVITHVPTAGTRIRNRGYDQASLIARKLAGRLGMPYTPLLGRLGEQRQLGKSRLERRKQMEQLFVPMRKQQIQGKQVLLIDDVITTGSTLEAAGQALKAAGARRVYAAVFAAA